MAHIDPILSTTPVARIAGPHQIRSRPSCALPITTPVTGYRAGRLLLRHLLPRVTVGYHRYFTHRAFKARRGLRIAVAVAGGLAAQGPVIGWVADHRRHHAFSDCEGDPHSPWLSGCHRPTDSATA